MQAGETPGVYNIPIELIKNGGEETTIVLTVICQKIWETEEWPKEWARSLVIPLPKKGKLEQCQNYRIISLISDPSIRPCSDLSSTDSRPRLRNC